MELAHKALTGTLETNLQGPVFVSEQQSEPSFWLSFADVRVNVLQWSGIFFLFGGVFIYFFIFDFFFCSCCSDRCETVCKLEIFCKLDSCFSSSVFVDIFSFLSDLLLSSTVLYVITAEKEGKNTAKILQHIKPSWGASSSLLFHYELVRFWNVWNPQWQITVNQSNSSCAFHYQQIYLWIHS